MKITLPMVYSNTNYSAVAIDLASNGNGVEYLSIGGVSYGRTTTSFYIIGNLSNRTSGSLWHTIGY